MLQERDGIIYEKKFQGEVETSEDVEKFLSELRFELAIAKHYEKEVHLEIWVERSPLTDQCGLRVSS